jgi:putative transposase
MRIKSSRVIWVLRHLIHKHGKPAKIRMDNGPEFIAKIAGEFSEMFGIEFKYIEPGKPTQNAFIERFNKSYREGVLDSYLFDRIEEVREVTEEWVFDYNHLRPHDALKGMPPVAYREKMKKNENVPYGLRSASATPSLHYAHKGLQETSINE